MKQKKCPCCKGVFDIERFVGKNGRERVYCDGCREKQRKRNRRAYHELGIKSYKQQREYRKKLCAQPLPEGQQRCTKCLRILPGGDFVVNGRNLNSCPSCREQAREQKRIWHQNLSGERRERHLKARQKQTQLRKQVVIEGYGGKCACCGETHFEFLSIDHPERNGYHDRKVNGNWSSTLYRKLIKEGFPATFRCLCFNCNWSLGAYGYCPHENDRQKL